MKTLTNISLALALTGLCAPAFVSAAAPGDSASTATPTTAPTPDVPVTGAAPVAPTGPAAIVDREFSSYDLDKSGDLNAAEFSAWVAKLRKPAADGAPQADSQNWSAGLFAQADTDHNQTVSKTEMTSLLAAAARG